MENNIRKSMYEKNLYEKVKTGIKNALIIYCVLGSIYGLGETLSRQTTGHVSSDIYTGKYKPTKIEKIVYEDWLGVDLSHYPKQK